MLCKTIDSSSYIADFKKRFSNFCDKSPILLSYIVTGDTVKVVIEDIDEVITFPIQYTIDVKSFIYGIRQVLIKRAYPVLERVIKTDRPITEDERLKMIEDGVTLELLPSSIEEELVKKYLIDRVIIYKDTFILKEIDTGKLFRYKLNKSSVFFLRKLRMGKLSEQEAAEYFFENAELLNEITQQER